MHCVVLAALLKRRVQNFRIGSSSGLYAQGQMPTVDLSGIVHLGQTDISCYVVILPVAFQLAFALMYEEKVICYQLQLRK